MIEPTDEDIREADSIVADIVNADTRFLTRDTIARTLANLRVMVEALAPFAEVAQWAIRNERDLKTMDMLLRYSDGSFAGHLHAQSDDFIRADAALTQTKDEKP